MAPALLEITVHIDRCLEIAVTKSLEWGSTVADLKRQLADDDPTGMLQPQDLTLRGLATGPLDDHHQLSEDLLELELLTDGAQGAAEPAPAEQHWEQQPWAEHQPWPEPQKAEVVPEQQWAAHAHEQQWTQHAAEQQWASPEEQWWAEHAAMGRALAEQQWAEHSPEQHWPEHVPEQQWAEQAPEQWPEQETAPVQPAAAQDPEQPHAQADATALAEQPGDEPAPEGPENTLFQLLDRSGKRQVSQRDVLVALKKHAPVRVFFGLPASAAEKQTGGTLEARLLAIQDAFEAGNGLGELAKTFDRLRGSSGGQTFGWPEFLAQCRKFPLKSKVAAASALFHREHAHGAAFAATKAWQVVPEGAACPGGLEYKMDMETGRTMARLPPGGPGGGGVQAPAAPAAPAEGGPLIYRPDGGLLFLKRSDDPASGKIAKVKVPADVQVYATGRVWTGPSGGRWAELDPSRGAEKGWALVDGPGFGLNGPALVEWGKAAPAPRLAEVDELPPGQDYEWDFLGVQRGKCKKCKRCGWYRSPKVAVGG